SPECFRHIDIGSRRSRTGSNTKVQRPRSDHAKISISISPWSEALCQENAWTALSERLLCFQKNCDGSSDFQYSGMAQNSIHSETLQPPKGSRRRLICSDVLTRTRF